MCVCVCTEKKGGGEGWHEIQNNLKSKNNKRVALWNLESEIWPHRDSKI